MTDAPWPLLTSLTALERRALLEGKLAGVIVPANALDGPEPGRANGPLVQVDRWVRDIVGRSAPGLDRRSPLCPFVTVARRDGHLHYAAALVGRGPACVDAVGESLLRRFVELWPQPAQDFPLKSLVVVFVDNERSGGDPFVDAHPDRLQTLAVRSGLMVHEFRSHDVTAMLAAAPVSTLLIRGMTPKDRRFLDSRPEWLAAYERRFGWPKPPTQDAERAAGSPTKRGSSA
jgi:hypothetical protein